MSILSIFASAAGCKKAPVDDTSALENPPPKPPNCPDLPELKNITLKDGTVVDVRIMQFLNTKLYIPTRWTGPFIDKESRGLGDFYDRGLLEKFQPNMHSVECPGVVHSFETKKIEMFVLHLRSLDTNQLSKNYSDDAKIENIAIFRRDSTDRDFFSPDIPGGAAVKMVMSDDIYAWILYSSKNKKRLFPENFAVGSATWKRDKKDLMALFAWLATLPAKRDNDRIFKLGVEGQ